MANTHEAKAEEGWFKTRLGYLEILSKTEQNKTKADCSALSKRVLSQSWLYGNSLEMRMSCLCARTHFLGFVLIQFKPFFGYSH